MQLIGTILCLAGIAWLFYLDRDPDERVSAAMWLPTLWFLICGSRSLAEWLAMRPAVSLAQQYSESSPIDAAFYAALIVAGIVVLNQRSHRVRSFLRRNLPLLLFFGYCALSVLWSDFPFIALKRWSKSVGDLVMVMVVLTELQPLYAIRTLFKRAAFVLLPLSVLFITCFPELGTGYNPEDMTRMYFGVTTFKNLLGVISMVCGLFSLWSFLRAYEDRTTTDRRRHILAHVITLGIACWLIVQADSMTSLACLVLAGTVLILVGMPIVLRWRAGSMFVVGAALMLTVIALFVDVSGSLLQPLGRNATLTGRTLIWHAVLALHANPWFGTGFESFWLGNRLERVWHLSVNGIQEAHNGYLEIYLNLGWCGLLLLWAVIAAGYKRSISALLHDRQDGRMRLGFLTATLIFSMTEAGFRMLSPTWLAFLLAASEIPSLTEAGETAKIPESVWIRTAKQKQFRVLQ